MWFTHFLSKILINTLRILELKKKKRNRNEHLLGPKVKAIKCPGKAAALKLVEGKAGLSLDKCDGTRGQAQGKISKLDP